MFRLFRLSLRNLHWSWRRVWAGYAFSLFLGGQGRRRSGSSLRCCCGGGGFSGTPAFWRRRRWRRRRWRCKRLQKFQRLCPRAQPPIQEQHENIIRNFGIFGHLWRDAQLGHLWQWNFLLNLPPLGKEVLDLLRYGLLPGGHSEKQNHL